MGVETVVVRDTVTVKGNVTEDTFELVRHDWPERVDLRRGHRLVHDPLVTPPGPGKPA